VSPGVWPRDEPLDERLLIVEVEARRLCDAHVRDLRRWLAAGDLLVVNDAATLPASLRARVSGHPAELRLLARGGDDRTWTAVAFDERDWHTRTEDRSAPAPVEPGTRVVFAEDLEAEVTAVDAASPRLLTIRFAQSGAALWSAIYRHGLPVQYAHVAAPLALWDTQTPFASRPWAVEQPSAGRPLAWRLLSAVRERGVELAWLTHAAGLSSTGDAAIDAALPLAERFDIPGRTVAAIAAAKGRGAKVVAAGTTVVRALEGCAAQNDGRLVAGEGVTSLRVGESHRRLVVDALLTGMHDPKTSHFDLLRAFAPASLLERAHAHAERAGYLGHEFGDSAFILGAA
jgi:S-adenosylmethionine:tRNA ribosyltransferase-isomerase